MIMKDLTSFISKLNFINGARIASASENLVRVVKPATGEQLCQLPPSGTKDVNNTVNYAKKAFQTWSKTSAIERSKVLTKAAHMIRDRCETITELEVVDTGKPIWEAREDVTFCADVLQYTAGVAPALNGETMRFDNGNFALIEREPLGVCVGIGAWNYPWQMGVFKSAPALACGNTFVFKPSPLTPLTAVLLAEIYRDAGLPNGCFNVVQGDATTGELLCDHSDVAKVSFTGSVPTGSKIMQRCAQRICPVTLELGGKSPLIVFEDADLDNAAVGAIYANFLCQGQVCSNGTRVFVHRSIMPEFTEKLIRLTKQMKIGDPMKEDTKVGATICEEHAHKVLGYIELAKKEGCEIIYGGDRVTLDDEALKGGWYLRPCVLGNCNDNMRVVKEEIFGSVLALLAFDSEEEVIKRANDTKLGLSAGVFTKDLRRAHHVTSEIRAGSQYINNYNVMQCQVPFGGYKMSGIGREMGMASLQHYTQLKSVYVEMGRKLEMP